MTTKKQLSQFGLFIIMDGSEIRFWISAWKMPYFRNNIQLYVIYNIVLHKINIITTVLESSSPNVIVHMIFNRSQACGKECSSSAISIDLVVARAK
jgi:hypothetical protein